MRRMPVGGCEDEEGGNMRRWGRVMWGGGNGKGMRGMKWLSG
jgi:hypothetical protein